MNSRTRRMAERASRRLVIRRRLPESFGQRTVYVSPGAMLRYIYPRIERHDDGLLAWASEFVREGASVWDIGANCGLFAFAASALAGPMGHVLAVEPDDFLVGLLRRSAALPFRGAHVDVLPAAVSDRVGVTHLNVAERGRASNALVGTSGRSTAGGVRDRYAVVSVTLDWLCQYFHPPNVLKVDIEGAELMAMSGGRSLLRHHRPVILCEVGTEQTAMAELLTEFRYSMYDLGSPDRRRIDVPTFNTLMIPE